jgi:hypothetical protein
MNPSILSVVIENADFLIAEALPGIVARKALPDEVFEFCTQLRRRGIAELLLRGIPDELLRQLSFSGRAFLHVLPAIPEGRRAAGEQRPFLDALASGDVECASHIAQMCPVAHSPGEELEEDFLFMTSLMGLMLDKREGVAKLVARYTEIVGEDDEPQLAVLRALVARDDLGFEEAITSRMKEVNKRYRDLQQVAITDEEAETEGRVSSEGIALVRLAGRLGMHVAQSYRMVPPPVWRATWSPGPPDEWMQP